MKNGKVIESGTTKRVMTVLVAYTREPNTRRLRPRRGFGVSLPPRMRAELQPWLSNLQVNEIMEGLTPLEYMLAVLRDETVEPERRDEMAKAAAPYLHPRLASIEAQVAITGHEAALAELE
jgi:hypothetical protein